MDLDYQFYDECFDDIISVVVELVSAFNISVPGCRFDAKFDCSYPDRVKSIVICIRLYKFKGPISMCKQLTTYIIIKK